MRNLTATITSAVFLFGLMIAPVHGGVLRDESFNAAAPGDFIGEIVTVGDGQGWHSGTPGDDTTQTAQYLSFPVAEYLLAPQGAIEFDLVRNNSSEIEALFSLVDAKGRVLLVAQIFWNGFYQRAYPSLKFNGVVSNKVWYRRFLRGGVEVTQPLFPFGKQVAPGQRFHFAFTWGGTPKECAIYLDGVRLPVQAEVPFGMIEAVERAQWLVIGGEPDEKGTGAYSMLGTVVNEFRTHDTVPDPTQFIIAPIIENITHDAFAVAGISGSLVAGDTVTVTEKAEPGGKASFDIVKPAFTTGGKSTPERVVVPGVAMAESADSPGTYTGTYTVRPGDHVDGGQVVGHFANAFGIDADPLAAAKPISIDGTVHLAVNPSNDLIPADESSRSGITITASDANGKHVKGHPLKLTMSATDEYTGTVGGGSFAENVGGKMEVDWRGVTDSFGEVAAQYISGFAAKTILVSAKDMTTGDIGVGYVRAFIDGTVDIVVKRPTAIAQAVSGSMEVSASRSWLTADGKSRSRITAVVRDASGHPVEGDNISFNLLGGNGSIRVIRSRTDSRGRAFADYIAGTVMGQVSIEVRDMTSGLAGIISIELRPDAPAEISLTADPGEVYIGGKGSVVTAKVTDVNGNPNADTDVLFEIVKGGGSVSAPSAGTDSRHGVASVRFIPGKNPGVSIVKGTVISRPPTDEEIAAAKGAVFLYGLADDPGRLEVTEWFAKPGDEVTEGQDLVTLEDRHGDTYMAKAPRDGVLATFVAEERDRVEYGQTLGYILPAAE